MRWSSRSLGSKLQHQVFYLIIRLAGRHGAYCLLFFVVSWYALLPSVRNRSKPYLTRRFPRANGISLLLRTWRLQWSFGQCLVDRAAAGILGDFYMEPTVKGEFESLLDESRGIILLAAHTGNWQIAQYALATHSNGRPVAVLGHREDADVDKEIFEHQGKEKPYQFVSAGDGYPASVALVNLLRKGGFLCTTGDRVTGDEKALLETEFLGHSLKISYLPFRLASATGARVIFVFARRTRPGWCELCFMDSVHVPEGLGGAPEGYRPYVRQYVAALEKFVYKHPYQFFNFCNIWE
ncbi:MAG: lysophospholipid acyltransferase family protein [Desulfovibrio sp.]|jgi:predicted LPLAT superfamily acyltransferase|nr:lysophospholipid acyltransferase family protein [Desulfovibrio sp.]